MKFNKFDKWFWSKRNENNWTTNELNKSVNCVGRAVNWRLLDNIFKMIQKNESCFFIIKRWIVSSRDCVQALNEYSNIKLPTCIESKNDRKWKLPVVLFVCWIAGNSQFYNLRTTAKCIKLLNHCRSLKIAVIPYHHIVFTQFLGKTTCSDMALWRPP